MPDTKGKDTLFKTCFACHGFESRMASFTRDEDGWRDRVTYMKTAMQFFLGARFGEQEQNDVVTYLTSTFGPNSAKAKSPADLPRGGLGIEATASRRSDEDRLHGVRASRAQPDAVERCPRKGRFLSGCLITVMQTRLAGSIPRPAR